MSDLLNRLRAVTVGAPKDFKSKIVEFAGEKFEIREPTEAQRAKIRERSYKITGTKDQQEVKVDTGELAVWSLICCAVVPGTGDYVFTEADYDCLINMPASQLDALKSAALEFVNLDREKMEKNFEKTTSDMPSSASRTN